MTDNAPSSVMHWAVLIGVNFYIRNENGKLSRKECLRGAVQDVCDMNQYLKAASHPVDIAILTATTPLDLNSTIPQEGRESWPTVANVIGNLGRVLNNARRGDSVYIHYSGHGTRTLETDFKLANFTHKRGNLALVLFEDRDPFTRYFYGQHLANCLQRMVEKGLAVTVVLDCCFSGSVLRSGHVPSTAVRAVDYDPTVETACPADTWNGLFDPGYTFRDSRMPLDGWLVNPKGYTILCACGPHEEACELELLAGERRGALSYFLLKTLNDLRRRCADITHESLYEHLRVKFRASRPQQTPMRYGNKSFSFFEKLRNASDMTFVPLYREKEHLYLDAGEAHGVQTGDIYAAYPFGTAEDSASQPRDVPITVRVGAVYSLRSKLVAVEPTPAMQLIETGWRAKPQTSVTSHTIAVRLAPDAYRQIKGNAALRQQRFIRLCTDDTDNQEFMFYLHINDAEEYDIRDGFLNKLSGVSSIPASTPGAGQVVIDIVQHLATFKYFERVENRAPEPSFEASFSILPSVDDSMPGCQGPFSVKHGGHWNLVVENYSDKPLYLAIFNFLPSWKISNLLSDTGDNAFRVVQPQVNGQSGKESIALEMTVPQALQDQGETSCEDLVKVFLTSKHTQFPSMILDAACVVAQGNRGATHDAANALSDFLASLTSPFRGQGDSEREHWATRNYTIRTTLKGSPTS